MARIYADAEGRLLRLLKTELEEARYPDPPEGTVYTLEFDAETNAEVIAALDGQIPGVRWQDHRLVGETLTRKGQAVTINQPGEAWTERDRALQALALLKAYRDSDTAPTAAQTVAAVRLIIWVLFYLLRRSAAQLRA